MAPLDRILQYEYRLPGSARPSLEEYLDYLAGRLGIGKRDDRREQQELVFAAPANILADYRRSTRQHRF
jgi:hypothetical protein